MLSKCTYYIVLFIYIYIHIYSLIASIFRLQILYIKTFPDNFGGRSVHWNLPQSPVDVGARDVLKAPDVEMDRPARRQLTITVKTRLCIGEQSNP